MGGGGSAAWSMRRYRLARAWLAVRVVMVELRSSHERTLLRTLRQSVHPAAQGQLRPAANPPTGYRLSALFTLAPSASPPGLPKPLRHAALRLPACILLDFSHTALSGASAMQPASRKQASKQASNAF